MACNSINKYLIYLTVKNKNLINLIRVYVNRYKINSICSIRENTN